MTPTENLSNEALSQLLIEASSKSNSAMGSCRIKRPDGSERCFEPVAKDVCEEKEGEWSPDACF